MTLQIPNYEIKSVLGEGGMAVVYLAEHRLLYNKVAIKVLNDEFVRNKNIRARFLAEARNMAKMSHQNIIKVFDLVDDGATVAFVMEYMAGETLKEYLERKEKLKAEEIGGLLDQMLSALEYTHDQGLIHRDIKPSNFMVSAQERLKLMDFGIAKQLNSGSPEYTSTGTNQQMGTALYMSPEQIHETRGVTSRSDIYSLGVVLWQMVTGKKPYSTETLSAFQLQTKIVNEPLPKTGTIWDNLIQKATEKDSQNRYADIFALRSAWVNGQINHIERRDNVDKTVMEQLPMQPVTKTPQGPAEISVEGSVIGSIRIGNQEWQAENLKVDRFRNGDEIPQVRSAVEWAAAGEKGEPVWCYYQNDAENSKIYGKLYNWYAVNDSRGLAPEGWHIPTDDEWTTLTDYLGSKKMDAIKMKSTGLAYWQPPNERGTYENSFSALPGGYRNNVGSFSNIGFYAFFWSVTKYDKSYAWYRLLNFNKGDVLRNFSSKSFGASVRCLKD